MTMGRPKKKCYFIDAGDYEVLLNMAKKWAMYSCYSEKSVQVDRLIKCEKRINKQKVQNENTKPNN